MEDVPFTWAAFALHPVRVLLALATDALLVWLVLRLYRKRASGQRETVSRLAALDARVAELPTPRDVGALADRVSAVEGALGEVRAEGRAAREASERTERMVKLLLEHALGKDAAPPGPWGGGRP